MKIGILPLGRPTFDVPYAEEKLAGMLDILTATNHEIIGPRKLLFDAAETKAAIDDLQSSNIDQLLLLQVTFTDASMSVEAAAAFDVPLSIWAVPEPRIGGRLRLNAFCGLNLASHALGLQNQQFSWVYIEPDEGALEDIQALLSGRRIAGQIHGTLNENDATDEAKSIVKRISGKRLARIGEHPVGFDTCMYTAEKIEALTGVQVVELEIDDLFAAGNKASTKATTEVMMLAKSMADGLEDVDAKQLEKSLRLKVALDEIRKEGGYDAFAIRCWPETFTEYGGAVCAPVSMLGEARVPCACEADVYGALTQLILMEAAQAPVFLTDLVDIDLNDGTGVVWHCGQAPISMRDPEVHAEATIHTNRKMPLLFEFTLKPGVVTFMRISQGFGETKMVLSSGEMLRRPMTFTGTSGVVQFERDADAVLKDIMSSGLEHHMALAYGEHRPLLRSIAAAMKIPVLEI